MKKTVIYSVRIEKENKAWLKKEVSKYRNADQFIENLRDLFTRFKPKQ